MRCLSVSGTGPLGGTDQVVERLLGLGPTSGLETCVNKNGGSASSSCRMGFAGKDLVLTTVGVDEEVVGVEDLQHGLDLLLHLLLGGNSGRVNVVKTGSDTRVVSLVLEGLDQLHVGLGGLDRDDVGVEGLDVGEDVVEVRVAEVGVDLGLGLGDGGREPI